jgi:hypothetical protein
LTSKKNSYGIKRKQKKKKKKRRKKPEKGLGRPFRPRSKSGQRPIHLLPNWYPPSPFSLLTGGTYLSGQVIVFNLHPKILPGDIASSPIQLM